MAAPADSASPPAPRDNPAGATPAAAPKSPPATVPAPPSRDDLAGEYLGSLPYAPYPLQEDALLAWFTSSQGVLVCAPTGTGKTLIAQAALFEALRTGTTAYYTTPLIALTEQKFAETQALAVKWGFPPESVGLVTGNRKVNPDARVLIVVAEILLNRLLKPEGRHFEQVSAVVMDEFHSFNDPARGIVWELTLALLPAHVRLMLLSATVGNPVDFSLWLARNHGRNLELVQGTQRKVPLEFVWVPDALLGEHLTDMSRGDPLARRTPTLVFCFNRDECWSLAEQFKGLHLLGEEQRGPLLEAVDKLEWKTGAGPKLKEILRRGVGVHHAGLLPKHRRAVEDLFERKLLPVVTCTETLAAGINLPARSVVLTSLVKGPPGNQKLIDPGVAKQIFGRAGRPQFDDRGWVYALAHEDDVKLLRWKKKFDSIPEDTKDPGLLRAKKDLKRKKPDRNSKLTYWVEDHFRRLQAAPASKLASQGDLPWRVLAHMLLADASVDLLRTVIRKRLMSPAQIESGLKRLDGMLRTLHDGGYVRLEPEPPPRAGASSPDGAGESPETRPAEPQPPAKPAPDKADGAVTAALIREMIATGAARASHAADAAKAAKPSAPAYVALQAHALPKLAALMRFRSVHPLYGVFLSAHLADTSDEELLAILESTLDLPRPMLKHVRPPYPDEMPPGPLEKKLDPELLARGLIAAPPAPSEDDDGEEPEYDWRNRPPTIADKMRLLFDATHPDVGDLRTTSVWCAGELLRFGGDFDNYVRSRDITKQEGIVFRHVLRLILLLGEFATVPPEGVDPKAWRARLRVLAERLTESCRKVDPQSTDKLTVEARTALSDEAAADRPGSLRPEDVLAEPAPTVQAPSVVTLFDPAAQQPVGADDPEGGFGFGVM